MLDSSVGVRSSSRAFLKFSFDDLFRQSRTWDVFSVLVLHRGQRECSCHLHFPSM
jgi:hypothetical protein